MQITCHRDTGASGGRGNKCVEVSIIPRPDADDALKTRLRAFRRSVENLDGYQLVEFFLEEVSNTISLCIWTQ